MEVLAGLCPRRWSVAPTGLCSLPCFPPGLHPGLISSALRGSCSCRFANLQFVETNLCRVLRDRCNVQGNQYFHGFSLGSLHRSSGISRIYDFSEEICAKEFAKFSLPERRPHRFAIEVFEKQHFSRVDVATRSLRGLAPTQNVLSRVIASAG